MARRFILLDRDGTLIVEKNYLSNPDGVELIPGAVKALAWARVQGWGVILLTNQSGIGRGYFTQDDLAAVHQRLTQLLKAEGVTLDAIYFCPHEPDDRCECRKPSIGMAKQAQLEWGFDPLACIVVGDKEADLALGRALRATTCLVRTGYGKEVKESHLQLADFILEDLSHLPEVLSVIEDNDQ